MFSGEKNNMSNVTTMEAMIQCIILIRGLTEISSPMFLICGLQISSRCVTLSGPLYLSAHGLSRHGKSSPGLNAALLTNAKFLDYLVSVWSQLFVCLFVSASHYPS